MGFHSFSGWLQTPLPARQFLFCTERRRGGGHIPPVGHQSSVGPSLCVPATPRPPKTSLCWPTTKEPSPPLLLSPCRSLKGHKEGRRDLVCLSCRLIIGQSVKSVIKCRPASGGRCSCFSFENRTTAEAARGPLDDEGAMRVVLPPSDVGVQR